MGRTTLFLFLSTVVLASCASHSFEAERRDSQNRVIALFSEPDHEGRCFSVVEPEPNQIVTVDLAKSVGKEESAQNLEECTKLSQKNHSAYAEYVSNITKLAAGGIAPMDNFEFKPNEWPAEFHYADRVYHIFHGKVLSVEVKN